MPEKILVVEDEPDNIAIFERLLSRKGYDILVADNKEDGIRMGTEEQPDLILMDIKMPNTKDGAKQDKAGLEAIRHLKSEDATKGIPIIALTAQTMVNDRKDIEEAGCDDMQAKPIEFAALLAAI
jgi:two-component system cell cycle response regulator DivK